MKEGKCLAGRVQRRGLAREIEMAILEITVPNKNPSFEQYQTQKNTLLPANGTGSLQ